MPLLLIALLFAAPATAMVVPAEVVQSQLNEAVVVADLRVRTLESFPHPDLYATFRATADVLAIHHTLPDGGVLPAVGDIITIEGPGGEWQERGVLVSGQPRPYAGRRYRAHLRRGSDNAFRIAGYEAGLVALDPARKFSRNRTDGSNGDGEGAFLFWDDSFLPIPYYVSAPTLSGKPDFVSAIDASFKSWRDPKNVKVEFLPMGCSNGVKNENEGLNHVILVSDNWPFSDPQVIAITRNFYIAGNSEKSGLILDSDILLNGVNHQFTTTDEPGKNDVQNIVTHEVGHFLGLGHEVTPTDTDAVMFANATPNETKKRTLKTSDLDGLAEAYAGIGAKHTWTGTPCDVAGGSCVAAHRRPGSPVGMIAMALVVMLNLCLGRKFVPGVKAPT